MTGVTLFGVRMFTSNGGQLDIARLRSLVTNLDPRGQAFVKGDVLTFVQAFEVGAFRISANLTLRLDPDGVPASPLGATSSFKLFPKKDAAPLVAAGVHLDLNTLRLSGDLAIGKRPFVVPANRPIVPVTEGLPLTLYTRDSTFGDVAFELDLPNQHLIFAPKAFQLDAGAGVKTSRWVTHQSKQLKVDLRRPFNQKLEFTRTDGRVLPLHAELLGQSKALVGLAALDNYSLELELGAGSPPSISALRATGDNVQLLTYRYGTEHNDKMRWTGQRFELGVRKGGIKPASLLIDRSASGKPLKQVVDHFHGLAASSRVENVNNASVVIDVDGWVALTVGGEIAIAKAGLAHTSELNANSRTIDTYRFTTSATAPHLTLPLVPIALESASKRAGVANSFSGLTSSFPATLHETGMIERQVLANPPGVSLVSLATDTVSTRIALDKHVIERTFGMLKLRLEVSPKTDLEIIPLTFTELQTALAGAIPSLPLPEVGKAVCDFAQLAQDAPTRIAAVVKLAGDRQLSAMKQLAHIAKLLDPVLDQPTWRGLILLDVPIQIGDDDTLKHVLNGRLSLAYLAITPQGPSGGVSIFGRVRWQPDKLPPIGSCPDDGPEVAYQLRSVDAQWRDSQLLAFQTESDLTFDSFFGLKSEGSKPQLSLFGSYDASTKSFRFAGRFREPLSVLPKNTTFGPIEQVTIDSAEVRTRAGVVSVFVDGQLTLRDFAGKGLHGNPAPTFKADPDATTVDFRDLGIKLPDIDAKTPWIGIDYPSLRLRVNRPVFKLGPFGLTLRSVGVDWMASTEPLSVRSDHSTNSSPLGRRAFLLGLRLELMKLPELASDPSRQLTFDFDLRFGLEKKRWNDSLFEFRIEGASATNIEIDLLRFLRLRIGKAEIEPRGSNVQMIHFYDVSVEILGKPIIDSLELYVFSKDGGLNTGVLLYVASTNWKLGGLLQIHWLLIGSHVEISEKAGNALLEPLSGSTDATKEPHTGLKNRFQSPTQIETTFDPSQGWVFGMGLSVLGDAFTGKFLIQDHGFCGGTLYGTIFEKWFGLKGAGISIAYVKKARADEDEFHVALAVPQITLGAFQFQGGIVAIHLALNGGFVLDAGFPWRENGTRRWDRSIGAIVTPFQASGGFYIQYLKSRGPDEDECTELGGGLALQLGLGAAAGGGWFRVWATIGIFAVLEGKLHIHKGSVDGVFLRGSIGLLGRAAGELNWWVISIRVEVFLSAEADATLLTGVYTKELSCGVSAEGARPQLVFDFDVVAGIVAEACIGGGLFKLCMKVSPSVHIHCSHTITL